MKDKAPTSEELRSAIDRGLAGDKVAYPDPAAAPLGADAEAGGAPPTASERRLAWREEKRVPGEHVGETIRGPTPVVSLPAILGIAAIFLLMGALLVSMRLP